MDAAGLRRVGSAMEGRMVETPSITVLMPVYKTPPRLLREAIASIRAQTWQDFEFLIVHDGDQEIGDSTVTELARQASEDRRIRLYWEPHRGLTGTLNRGLELARGEWIARQDSDDWSDPHRLTRQMAEIRSRRGLILCGSNARLHREDGKELWSTHLPEEGDRIREAFLKGNPFVHGSTMFHAATARALGGYREAFPCSQDYDLFWRLSDAGGVVNVKEPLYHYRFTSGAISIRRAADQARAHLAARVLAAARVRGEQEDIAQALSIADAQLSNSVRERTSKKDTKVAALKQADHRLLAGDHRGALMEYLRLSLGHPCHLMGWGKLARWVVFTLFPAAREVCFR